jgi:hypothetical protein
LTSDGTSDRSLIPIINWALEQNDQLRDVTIVPQFYDPRGTMTPSRKLEERLQDAIKLFPRDVLFVHRDAEREPPEKRRREIDMAIAALGNSHLALRRLQHIEQSLCINDAHGFALVDHTDAGVGVTL